MIRLLCASLDQPREEAINSQGEVVINIRLVSSNTYGKTRTKISVSLIAKPIQLLQYKRPGCSDLDTMWHALYRKKTSLLVGIATDSQSRILTSDFLNNVIIILDRDEQFLRNIDTSLKIVPWGLCVDSKENLFVTEFNTGKIMKMKIPQ